MKKITFLAIFFYSLGLHAQYVKWANAYPALGENTLPRALSVSGNENLAFTTTYVTPGSDWGAMLYKTDSMGTVFWKDSMEIVNPDFGGYQWLRPVALDFDQGENLYLGVNFNDTLSFAGSTYPSSGMTRSIMVRYLANGTKDFLQLWDNASINAITHDPANNTVVLMSFSGTISFFGQVFTATGASDILIASIDASNNVVFSKQIHGGTAVGTKLEVTDANNYVVLGHFEDTLHYDGIGQSWSHDGSPDAFVMKIAPTGTVLGYHVTVASIMDYEDDIAVSFDEKTAASGHGSWTYNAWATLKTYDALMNETSSMYYSDDDYSSVHTMSSLAVPDNAGFWALGYTSHPLNEGDPADDIFFLQLYKFDFMGNLITTDSFQLAAYLHDRSAIHIDEGHAGNFYTIAPLEGSVTMGSYTVTNSGPGLGFMVAKFNEAPDVSTAVAENEGKAEVSLFPNPGKGEVRIKTNMIRPVVNIYDMTGRKLRSIMLNSADNVIETGLPEGIYNVEIIGGGHVHNTKLVVMK